MKTPTERRCLTNDELASARELIDTLCTFLKIVRTPDGGYIVNGEECIVDFNKPVNVEVAKRLGLIKGFTNSLTN